MKSKLKHYPTHTDQLLWVYQIYVW